MAASLNNARLLPPNSTRGERAIVDAASVRPLPVDITSLWDADKCPASLLPWLAWMLSVDDWKADWSDAVKRSRLRSAMAIQRRKGTANSVRMVVASFGGAVTIREWWQQQPHGQPHTFELTLTLNGSDGRAASARFVDEVIAEVERTKPVRSHFSFVQGLQATGNVSLVNGVRIINYRRLSMTAQG